MYALANTSLTNKATTVCVTKNAYVSALVVGATLTTTVEAQHPISAAAKSTKKRKASLVQSLGAEEAAAATATATAGGGTTEARSSNRFLSDFDSQRTAHSILQAVSIGSCFESSTTLYSENAEADLEHELD